jgi:hypothetical protein
MPELYWRPRGDVNNREKRAAMSATCSMAWEGRGFATQKVSLRWAIIRLTA